MMDQLWRTFRLGISTGIRISRHTNSFLILWSQVLKIWIWAENVPELDSAVGDIPLQDVPLARGVRC